MNFSGKEDTMNSTFLLSIVFKGIGAILEIILQILITSSIGVDGYGTYSTWINGADLVFWVALSGLVKCNTFYLSGKDTSIKVFKKRYYFAYAIPLLIIVTVLLQIMSGILATVIIPVIAGLELLVLDRSSTYLARGYFKRSLLGEYTLGRIILVIGIVLFNRQGYMHVYSLLGLYVFQYLLVLAMFCLNSRERKQYIDISQDVSIKKCSEYQKSDLMHSMIEQMPIVVQYLFSGAFEAGVVSIVLLVKKLINFISGPTAKVFLPEFSRFYHAGDKEGICNCYRSIMRIQMIVVGPMSVVLIGYPYVVLGILASELLEYRLLFVICSVIFLVAASLGPCGGILQMTGNEKDDNRCRLIALAVMVLIMLMTRKDSNFVLYGLCGQVALEVAMKYRFVCKWMRKTPVNIIKYVSWWMVPAVAVAVTYIFQLQNSFVSMVIAAFSVFVIGLVQEK